MKVPEKITKYPWRTAGIVVALILILMGGMSEIFGPDQIAEWVEDIARFGVSFFTGDTK